jgi:peroxiredoxin Q/BCP
MPTSTTSPIIEKPKKAPRIKGIFADGMALKSDTLNGHWVVLFFYPKDMTSGCTAEAAAFQDSVTAFKKLGSIIIGVSKDSPKRHLQFTEKLGLEFDLIADEAGELCEAFDVWKEKKLYGRNYMGIERSTFLVDPAGKLVAEWRKVKVPGHASEVLKVLTKLAKDYKN